MNNEKMEISVPVIATRGIIVFPQQDIMIEVGREKSIRAVEEAEEKFDGHVWLVCQKDIMFDNPAPSELYTFGTLCRIKNIRRKEGGLPSAAWNGQSWFRFRMRTECLWRRCCRSRMKPAIISRRWL